MTEIRPAPRAASLMAGLYAGLAAVMFVWMLLPLLRIALNEPNPPPVGSFAVTTIPALVCAGLIAVTVGLWRDRPWAKIVAAVTFPLLAALLAWMAGSRASGALTWTGEADLQGGLLLAGALVGPALLGLLLVAIDAYAD